MKDESLMAMAQRIRDRAIQRGGELLLQQEAARGKGKRPINQLGVVLPLTRARQWRAMLPYR
jgi:hypothetical protein